MEIKLKSFIHKRNLILLVVLFIIIGGILYYIFKSTASNVEKARVSKGKITEVLSLSGEINSSERANLSFQLSGTVAWVGVKVGDLVQKNQAIASLDQKAAEKNLQQKLIEYSKMRINFDETKYNNQNRTPQQALNQQMQWVLEQNQYNLDLAVISVELQALVKELSTLFSPIEGIVTKADPEVPGTATSTFSPGNYEIVNPKTIFFSVSADQADVTKLKNGMQGTIIFDSYPEKTFIGTITSIGFTPKTNEVGTIYEIRVRIENIDNSNYSYRLGMTGNIDFILNEKKNTFVVPFEFVKEDEKGKYVFIDSSKKVKKYVKTGLESDSTIEILEGVLEGTIVYD